MFLYIAQPDCLYVVLLQRLKELALRNRILTLRKTVNEPDSPTTLRYVFKCALRWRTSATRSLSCKVASGVNPVISANCDQRWTFSVLTFAPKICPPITAITQQLLLGMQGSCSSGAFNGIPREPSASMRITSHSGRCTSASIASGVNPCTFPGSLSSCENKMKWGM